MNKLTGLTLMVLASFNVTAEPDENRQATDTATPQEATEQPSQTEPQRSAQQPDQLKPRAKFKPTEKISEDFAAPYPVDI